ncbi:methylmalonyl Co-A mutase-associated GTPase MeaB [Brevibacillus ginsengisoli]|uniref:methylmalonyl Co-A mutase-associated GTPase MeaB n=1 Tax=Brevibacillus ginsengisoli TaxID=363854 RepID=UPI003CF9E6CE
MNIDEWVYRICAGDLRAVARGLTHIEAEDSVGREIAQKVLAHTGKSHVIGLTGAPGVGKSTLVNQLIKALRKSGAKVGVLAVDPSSPYSGGAILGDRIRMMDSVSDSGVFMRSISSDGHLGGLSRTTGDAISLLDAAGFDFILVETVGIGQSEIEIIKFAHTTMIVLAPGLGDDIQAIKSGILEVGQIFVVNKADRDGSAAVVQSIQSMLHLKSPTDQWDIPVIKTVAQTGEGIETLVECLRNHYNFLKHTGCLTPFKRVQIEYLVEQSVYEAVSQLIKQAKDSAEWKSYIDGILRGNDQIADAFRWICPQEKGQTDT